MECIIMYLSPHNTDQPTFIFSFKMHKLPVSLLTNPVILSTVKYQSIMLTAPTALHFMNQARQVI